MIPLDTYLEKAGIKDKFSAFTTGLYWAEQIDLMDISILARWSYVRGIFVRKDWMEEPTLSLTPDLDDYFQLVEALTDESKTVMVVLIVVHVEHLTV